jgi:Fur family peroxide stress response transcriptional regulator
MHTQPDTLNVSGELERFTRACRDKGTPVTHQRLAVYRVLLESVAHPDADTIFQQLKPHHPTLSPATVYNTLELLEGLGLVKKVGSPGTSRRFDANRHPHHHLWCERCHSLTDVEFDATPAVSLPPGVDFAVSDFTIQFSGLCAACKDAGPVSPSTTGDAR